MDTTGDPGHTAWFQSRVQVLVRSLRSHPQWRDRLRDVEPSTSSPPTQRRPLQLGRSLASRWQQYSPAPLRRLKRLFSTSSERDPNEQDDGWESDNEDLRRQQLRLSAANVGGSGSLSDTSPLLPRESPIEGPSTAGDVGKSDEERLTNLLQNTWRKELNSSEHSQEVQIAESNKDSSNIPEELHNNQASHSKPLSPSQELPLPNEVPAAAATIPENSFEDSVTTSKSSDFNTDFSVLTTSTRDEDGEGRCSESSQNEMTQWRRSEDDTEAANGSSTPANAYSTVTADVEIEGLSEADKSDSLISLTNGKLDEEVAALLSSESVEENSSVIEVRVSAKGASVDVSSVNVDMAQNVNDECFYKVEESEGMAVIGVVIKSEMETCAADETDQASMPPPSIVLDLPQTIDHLPSEVTSVTAGVTTTSTTSSKGPNRPPKLQLDITTAACPQPAARKSPVTVQEWVDSLPLPVQHR
ncbi:hypothetical protein C0J52_19774 [Blattella germanica]|nr:hypothetical protein C0J52_19774 [Blattella germanica]PSN41801.1 hypothetical protein C0J52_19774 [Blattella germanica]